MNKITFVAFLYILAGTGLLLGSAELFMKVRFDLGSERAVMKSTDPVLARTAKYNPTGGARAEVDYETSRGTVPVHDLYLSPDQVHKLVQGEGIPVRFMKSDPHWHLDIRENPPSGIGWLALGLIASSVAVFAHRLLRREAGVG